MAQTNLNFEDLPSTKVGKIGEEIIKSYLQSHGTQVLPPPDVAANGASRVDFLVVGANGNKVLVEVKTWRQRVRNGERVFVMEKSKYDAYKKYSAEKKLPLWFYIVDTSSEFDAGATMEPCIRWCSLDGLKEDEDEAIFKEGEEDGVPCIYLPISSFFPASLLKDEDTKRLVAAIREMDAAREAEKPTPSEPVKIEELLLAEMREMYAAREAETPTPPEPVEIEKPVETPTPKVIRTGFKEVYYQLKPFENGEPLRFYHTSDGQIICYNAPIFKNSGYRSSYSADGTDHLSRAVNQVCKEVYDTSQKANSQHRIWALKVEDVEPVLEIFIKTGRKPYADQAKLFLKYWQEEVMPTVKGLKTAPPPQKSPSVTAPDKPAATFKRLFDGAVIDTVITEAQRFKRLGLNGTSLITAIRYVADRDAVDLKALEKFASYVQAESHETADVSARR